MDENNLIQRLRGRAAYLRNKGEVKSSGLMEDAAHELERLHPNDPKIEVEGPTATHNQSCAVRHGQPAVLDMNQWVFQPSWTAQDEGWRLVQARNRLQRAALKLLFAT